MDVNALKKPTKRLLELTSGYNKIAQDKVKLKINYIFMC